MRSGSKPWCSLEHVKALAELTCLARQARREDAARSWSGGIARMAIQKRLTALHYRVTRRIPEQIPNSYITSCRTLALVAA